MSRCAVADLLDFRRGAGPTSRISSPVAPRSSEVRVRGRPYELIACAAAASACSRSARASSGSASVLRRWISSASAGFGGGDALIDLVTGVQAVRAAYQQQGAWRHYIRTSAIVLAAVGSAMTGRGEAHMGHAGGLEQPGSRT